jgi:hypothetical protein
MSFGLTRIDLRDCFGKLRNRHSLLLLGLVAIIFSASIPKADAAVCARGVYRAGCVGPRGAVGVRRSYYNRYRGSYRYYR